MEALSVPEVARMIFGRNGDGLLAMISGFFDDSGTHKGAPVIAWSGLIAPDTYWVPFDKAWRAKLSEPLPGKPPLSRFHMYDCEHGTGEFEGYNRAERDSVIREFREIILNSQLIGFSVSVGLDLWESEVRPQVPHPIAADPEFFCMAAAAIELVDIATRSQQSAALVFDNRQERAELNKTLFQHFLRAQNMVPDRSTLVGISFLSSVGLSPLQGADMFAWENYRYSQVWLQDRGKTPPRPHYRRMIESGRFRAKMFDTAAAASLVARYDEWANQK